MSDAARQLMTADEFLLWNLEQEERWELIDGVPRRKFDNGPGMMAGTTEVHDQIVVNLLIALRSRLRGGPCRVKSADQASRMVGGNVRFPDVTVDCGPRAPQSLESKVPTVFVEVLSRSTRRADLIRKSDEYRRLSALQHFALVEPDRAKVLLWSRGSDGDWTPLEIVGLDAAVDLSAIGVSLPMAEIYEDVELSPRPQLE